MFCTLQRSLPAAKHTWLIPEWAKSCELFGNPDPWKTLVFTMVSRTMPPLTNLVCQSQLVVSDLLLINDKFSLRAASQRPI